jgi:hypothetical protein
MVVGTDVPDITVTTLAKAELLLDTNDVVFGPAKDGGFYLLGVKRPIPGGLFDITWSTDTVLQECFAAAQRAGLRVADTACMDVLIDIDTFQVNSFVCDLCTRRHFAGHLPGLALLCTTVLVLFSRVGPDYECKSRFSAENLLLSVRSTFYAF